MKDRIIQIMQKEGLTSSQFAEKIAISPASLSHIINGRNKPSLEMVQKIRKACSYVNLEWLLDGTGEMEISSEKKEKDENTLFKDDENPFFASAPTEDSEFRKEMEPKMAFFTPKEIVREEVKYIEKPSRKITEIRIFFDNGTYETFHPDK